MLLDTNILVRHLTGEPTEQAAMATVFLRDAVPVELAALVVADLVYVLESVYERTRPQVAALVRAVLAHPPVHASEGTRLLRAVELYETKRVHFAEAYLAAIAQQGDGLVASFERDLDRIDSVTSVEPLLVSAAANGCIGRLRSARGPQQKVHDHGIVPSLRTLRRTAFQARAVALRNRDCGRPVSRQGTSIVAADFIRAAWQGCQHRYGS